MKKLSINYDSRGTKEILIISKPLSPPWNDSGKNLVKDLLNHTTKNRFHVFSHQSYSLNKKNIITEQIDTNERKFTPSYIQKSKILLRLLKPDPHINIYHFFYTPNILTSLFARFAIRFKNKKTIQNISSSPKNYKKLKNLIFADRIIVLSEYNKQKLLESGVRNVTKINPGIELKDSKPQKTYSSLTKVSIDLSNKPVVLFPGDYEFSKAHSTILECMPNVLREIPNLKFVFACRIKTNQTKKIEILVKSKVKNMGISKSVIFLNEVENMHELIRMCDLVIFPAKSLYAKMDIPLVLIESLFEQKPIVISDMPPLNEIMKAEAGIKIKPGDSNALGKAIIKLIKSESLRREMGSVGRSIVKEHFDIRKIVESYEEIYEHI